MQFGYNEKFLTKNAKPGSTIIMTPNAFMTTEAWDEMSIGLKAQDNFLHTRKWNGTSNFLLEKFFSQHRNAFVSMTQRAQYISFQLRDEGTQVTYLLDALQNKDPHLMVAIALVKNDEGTEAAPGKRKNFEWAASFIIPNCPVACQ